MPIFVFHSTNSRDLKQGHCDLSVTESRICYKLKEIKILGDDNRLGGDDSVPSSGEGRVDFQKVSGYIVNARSANKRPSKVFGNIIINSISNSSCTTVHEAHAETTNSQPLFEKRLQKQSSSRSTLQGETKLVDIKPKSVKWEVSNFSPGGTFYTVRCIKDRLGAFCQKTSIGGLKQNRLFKYIRSESKKICGTNNFHIQKGLSSPSANAQSRNISLFGKNGRDKKPTHDSRGKGNIEILFSQSDHTYSRISSDDFKYQGRQGLQENEKFVKRMNIKQSNVSETDTGFRNSGCGSACIQVVPPDPKVHELTTRSMCMDGGCISNNLDPPKSIRLLIFCSYRETVNQDNEGQVYVDYNNTSVVFPNMVNPVIENLYTRSNIYSHIFKSFYRPKPEPEPRPQKETSTTKIYCNMGYFQGK